MQWAYPLGFVAMGVEGALTGPAPPTVLASGLALFGAAKALEGVGDLVARPALDLPRAGAARRAARHPRARIG